MSIQVILGSDFGKDAFKTKVNGNFTEIVNQLADKLPNSHDTDETAHADIRQVIANINASDEINTHNISEVAHTDIRQQINDLAPIDVFVNDANGVSKPGFYRVPAEGINTPVPPGILRHERYDNAFAYQEFIQYTTEYFNQYIRFKINNVWSNWNNVATTKTPNWVSPTFLNGWRAHDTIGFVVALDALRKLTFKGIIMSGVLTPGTVLFTLPVQYRPTVNRYICLISHDGTNTNNVTVRITSSGNVDISAMSTAPLGYIVFDNVSIYL